MLKICCFFLALRHSRPQNSFLLRMTERRVLGREWLYRRPNSPELDPLSCHATPGREGPGSFAHARRLVSFLANGYCALSPALRDRRGGPELDYRPNGTRKICSEGGGLFASTFAANGIANLWNQLSVFNQSACNIACDSM